MSEAELFSALGIETEKLDVVLVTNQDKLPFQIGKMLFKEGYNCKKVSVERFIDSQEAFSRSGTIIVDTAEIADVHRDGLIRAVKNADAANTAAILINNAVDFPLDDFRFASLLKSSSFNELLGRVESNIRFSRGLKKLSTDAGRPVLDAAMNEQIDALPDTVEQLKMAGRVQRDFLPVDLPNSDRIRWASMFKPAEWVSGDIYDAVRLDEQHVGFYIADAVGHSMPAALLTMFLKQALVMRQSFQRDYQIFVPQDVMRKLNNRMTAQHLTGCLFATCWYGLLNIRTMQLTHCRAGHPYPILVRKGQKPVQLESQGGLLGIFTDGQFEQETVQLHRGDKVIIYSDGVESIIGDVQDSKFVFDERFKAIVDLPVEQMMDSIERLAQDRDLEPAEVDDMTAVALEIL